MEDMDKPALCRSVNGPHVTTFDGRYAPPTTNMLIILNKYMFEMLSHHFSRQ